MWSSLPQDAVQGNRLGSFKRRSDKFMEERSMEKGPSLWTQLQDVPEYQWERSNNGREVELPLLLECFPLRNRKLGLGPDPAELSLFS